MGGGEGGRVTCQNCGLVITDEEAADPMLEAEHRCISMTDRCVGCEFQHSIDERIRELKGEDSGRTDIRANATA